MYRSPSEYIHIPASVSMSRPCPLESSALLSRLGRVAVTMPHEDASSSAGCAPSPPAFAIPGVSVGSAASVSASFLYTEIDH